jgi:penicillin-binding protein activator
MNDLRGKSMKHHLTLFGLLCATVLFWGCGGSKQVTRIDAESTTDLSGEWNDTDSRLVANEMISDVMAQSWLKQYVKKEKHKPTLVVGKITNRTTEHIEVKTFVKNLERAMLNSGEVEFVADATEREQVRDERKDQAKQASEETQKGPGKESGADFMLIGNISSIVDQVAGEKTKFYQVNMELVNIESNKKVWIGEKKLKKAISQDRVTW